MAISIALLGSACIGLVWGWLMGLLVGRVYHPWTDAMVLIASSLLVAVEISMNANLLGSVFFACIAMMSLFVHFKWRCNLMERFGLCYC